MKEHFYVDKNPLVEEEIANSLSLVSFEGKVKGHLVKRFDVNKEQSSSIGIPQGKYVTVNGIKTRSPASVVGEELKGLIGRKNAKQRALVVGVGNPYMVTDSLGPSVIESLMRKRPSGILLFTPYLEGITGISSYDAVRAIVKEIKPNLVIVVDALSARSVDRICSSYQMSDAGITPGSAMGKIEAFNERTLGVKTIAIGTPTVVNCKCLDHKSAKDLPDLLVCPKNVDELIKKATDCIASAILKAME